MFEADDRSLIVLVDWVGLEVDERTWEPFKEIFEAGQNRVLETRGGITHPHTRHPQGLTPGFEEAHANAGGAIQREVVSMAELIPSHVQKGFARVCHESVSYTHLTLPTKG